MTAFCVGLPGWISGHTVHKQTTGKRFARQNMHAPQTEIIPVVISAAMPPPELSSHAPPGIAGSRLTEPYIQSALVQAEVVISTMTVPCHGPCTTVCIAVVHHLCPAVCTVAENELTGGKHGTRLFMISSVVFPFRTALPLNTLRSASLTASDVPSSSVKAVPLPSFLSIKTRLSPSVTVESVASSVVFSVALRPRPKSVFFSDSAPKVKLRFSQSSWLNDVG